MKWFKLDSDFPLDGKILNLTDKELRIWLCIVSEISKKYTGKEDVFELDLNRLILGSKSKQTKFISSLNSVCTQFEIKMNLKQNENKLIISYPKFLKKQSSYFRGALTKTHSMQHDKKKKEKEINNNYSNSSLNSNYNNYSKIKQNSICCTSKKKSTTPGSMVWLSYADAYERKYTISPTRNAKTNAQCKRLVGLVGAEKACQIVSHFLTVNDQFYLKKAHDLGLCISDYQKILTSMEAKINLTTTKANQIDRAQTNHDNFDEAFEIIDDLKAKGKL